MNYSKCIRNSCLSVLILLQSTGLLAQGIHVTGGCKLIMSGSVKLVLHEASFNNEGFFGPGNGTLLFTGGQNAFISSNTTLSLKNVIINKSFGSSVSTSQDATLNGILTMSNGNLLLNNQSLYFGDTARIEGESDLSHITSDVNGRLFLARVINTPPNALNPGNLGLELTIPTAPGLIVIERRHSPVQLTPGMQSIRRNYNLVTFITPTVTDIRFFYLDVELGGEGEEPGLGMWTESDVSNQWTPLGSDGHDRKNNWVLKTGLGRWGRFTLANSGGPSMRIRPLQKPEEINQSFINSVRIYPNPSRDQFVMELASKQEKDMVLKLYDQSGRLLQQKQIHCRAGVNMISWNISAYASGVYYIASENAELKNIKIIKQ